MTRALVLSAWIAVAAAAAPAQASRFTDRFASATVYLRPGSAVPSLITGVPLRLGPDGAAAAEAFVKEWLGYLGADPALSKVALDRVVPVAGFTAYRFAQFHRGLPVLGADVVVTADAAGAVRVVSNSLRAPGPVDAAFTVTGAQAAEVAAADASPEVWGGKASRVERVVAFAGGAWRAVWAVEVGAARPLARWRVLVDGRTGEVVGRANLVRHVQGYAYPNCPETGDITAVELADLTSATQLVGSFVSMFSNCVPINGWGADCRATNRQATAGADGQFLIAPAEGNDTDPFAEVQTYYHLGQMHDYFSSQGLTAQDVVTRVAVNFTLDPQMGCNAAFLGDDAIIVGLCSFSQPAVNFAYDALSVMHEYTHGMVEHAAGLVVYETDEWGLVGMPGALNEGYADFFPAVVLDFPLVGRHVAPALGMGEFMRNLDDVAACPANLDGEVHEDGRIWGGANWAAFHAAGKDPRLATSVLVSVATLSSRPTLADAANAALAVAQDGPAPVLEALRGVYTDRGLLGCGREVALGNFQTATGQLMNPADLGLDSGTTPFVAQYRVDVPAGATSLTLRLAAEDLATAASATSKLRVYANAGSHVVYGGATSQADFDSNGAATLTIDAPAPGPYYILPVGTRFSRSSYGYRFHLAVEVADGTAPDAGPGPDAAAPADAGRADAASPDAAPASADGGACGCDTSDSCDGECACDPHCSAPGDGSDEGCSCGAAGAPAAGGISLALLGAAAALRASRRRR